MGQVANDVINGVICKTCHGYVGPASGYPRECTTCKGTRKAQENNNRHKDK